MSEHYASRERADAIWTMLVEKAGAREDQRWEFVGYIMEVNRFGHEFRFMGTLGSGGKLYSFSPREGFYVSCYPEDRTPERTAVIDAANEWLESPCIARKAGKGKGP
jgi:hypothetical protein